MQPRAGRAFAAALIIFLLSPPLAHASDSETDPQKKKKAGPVETFLTLPAKTVQDTGRLLESRIFNLGEIVVSGSRLSSDRNAEVATDLPQNITVMGPAQLERGGPGQVPGLLVQQEGVSYTDDLGGGLAARVDLRGFGGEGKQALVLLDGLRAVEPVDNSVTWQLYPVEFMKQIEIRRGGGSTVYGEGALSGTILLQTKGPTEKLHLATESALGDFGTRKHFAEVSGTVGGTGFYAGAHDLETDGYRRNSDHEGVSTLLKADREFSDVLKSGNSFYFTQQQTGIAGPLTATEMLRDRRQQDPDGHPGDEFRDRLLQDEWKTSLYLERPGIELTNVTGYRHRNQDSTQTFSSGTSMNAITTDTYSDVLQAEWSLEGERAWVGRYRSDVSAGVEWSTDDIHNPSLFDFGGGFSFPGDSAIDRRTLGGFVQERVHLGDRIILEAGSRWDRIDWDIYDLLAPNDQRRKKADAMSPKIGVEYKLFEPLALYASASNSFKVPDAATLIFDTPGVAVSNPDIDPQLARHREAGLRYAHPVFGSIRGDLFYVETKKEILFNAASFKNENFDTIRSGAEAAAETAPCDRLQLFANYTYTRAEFDNGAFDGKAVPLVPESKWTGGFVLGPFAGVTVSAQAVGHYGQFALNDFSNRFPINDYWTLGGRLSYHRNGWEIFVRAENLLGEEYSSFVTSNAAGVLNFNPAPQSYVEGGFRIEL
ncbi:MAG TPA: TonB-dependent receptor [Candidatus Eisenbacteria bacterium]|nr:TonB-dependent receptor [Candidatus Eisenbacteria bacterium]